MEKNKKENKPKTKNDMLKYEIAGELGLMDKIEKDGWKSLTAKESGKIGGIMNTRITSIMNAEKNKNNK